MHALLVNYDTRESRILGCTPENAEQDCWLKINKMSLGTWKIRFKSHYFVGLLLIALVAAGLCLTGDNVVIIEDQDLQKEQQDRSNEEQKTGNEGPIPDKEEEARHNEDERISRNNSVSGCNLFSGRWVFDNISYPLYKEGQCSFMYYQYACEKNRRKDLKYQNWRWQPHDCDIPRFNGTALLEKIRGKKLAFVGDSLNRNQWTSMLCLIESSLPQSSHKSVVEKGNWLIFQATEHNATIGFYWSPLLVESNCDDPDEHHVTNRIIRFTAIEKHARQWNDADILVFDSFMWWPQPTMTLLWGSFGSPDAIYKRVEMRHRRYEMALNTWSDWLEININRTKTKLFFTSLSPFHFEGETMDMPQCYCNNQTEPVFKEGYWGATTDREMMQIAESTIQKLETRGLKVEYLNITHLSDYRKDGHPSIYRKLDHPPTKEELAGPRGISDCAHWCLPGVPDVWNQILYSYIMNS